jgi:hypothetical protein
MASFSSLLPTLAPEIAALAKTAPAVFVKSQFLHFQILHILSFSLLGGCAILLGLRLIGLWADDPLPAFTHRIRRILNLGLAAALLTGLIIGIANPVKLYEDPSFLIKVAALGAGLLVTYAIALPLGLADGAADHRVLSSAAAAAVACGGTLWLFAATTGANPGIILVVLAGAALLAFLLRGLARSIFIAGLVGLLAAQMLFALGGLDDFTGRMNEAHRRFALAEGLWVLGFMAYHAFRMPAGARLARPAGYAMIVIWLSVAAAGRWIAFS